MWKCANGEMKCNLIFKSVVHRKDLIELLLITKINNHEKVTIPF